MRGLVIEWVTVKAFHEDFVTGSGKVSVVWETSVHSWSCPSIVYDKSDTCVTATFPGQPG